jgi:hypothetical protein
VAGHEVVCLRHEPPCLKEGGAGQSLVVGRPFEVIAVEHIHDRVPGDHDALGVKAFANSLRFVLLEVRIDHIGEVVDQQPVLLLRHAPIVGAHAAFDVDHGDVQLCRGNRSHDRVGVSEEDGRHRTELAQNPAQLGDEAADDLCIVVAAHVELNVGTLDRQLPEEHVLQVLGVVLPGPDEDELAVP